MSIQNTVCDCSWDKYMIASDLKKCLGNGIIGTFRKVGFTRIAAYNLMRLAMHTYVNGLGWSSLIQLGNRLLRVWRWIITGTNTDPMPIAIVGNTFLWECCLQNVGHWNLNMLSYMTQKPPMWVAELGPHQFMWWFVACSSMTPQRTDFICFGVLPGYLLRYKRFKAQQ